jgi:small-conductance mechanosensitive channel
VKLGGQTIFQLLRARAEQSAVERADKATKALDDVFRRDESSEARAQRTGELVAIYVGNAPIVDLSVEDAVAAGEQELDLYAEKLAAQVTSALHDERQRSSIARTVLSWSLVVLFGLLALFLLRKIGDLTRRLRNWVSAHPERVGALRVHTIEVLPAAAWQSLVSIGLSAASLFVRLGLVYGWLLVVASLFASTRGLAQRLTGLVVEPLSALTERLASTLPVAVVVLLSGLVLLLLLRFIKLYFESLERGETTLPWLSQDLARPTSVLLRLGAVTSALVFAAPVVTGELDGAFARSGLLALATFALAAVPLLASATVGVAVVFFRRLRVGDHVEYGGVVGRVQALTLLDASLVSATGNVRVPHLLSLVRPTRTLDSARAFALPLTLPPDVDLGAARQVLEQAVAGALPGAVVELTGLDAAGAHFLVVAPAPGCVSDLYVAAATSLREAGLLPRGPGEARVVADAGIGIGRALPQPGFSPRK